MPSVPWRGILLAGSTDAPCGMGRSDTSRYHIPAIHIYSGSIVPVFLREAGKRRQDQGPDLPESVLESSHAGISRHDMQRTAEIPERTAQVFQCAGANRSGRNAGFHSVYEFQATLADSHRCIDPGSLWGRQLHCGS